MSPTLKAAFMTRNHGRTSARATSSPAPSSPSMAEAGTVTPDAWMGADRLPRNPSPSKDPGWLSPDRSAGTSHIVQGPAPAGGRLDHPQLSASPAEVIQLFLASNRTSSPDGVAVLIGAQK